MADEESATETGRNQFFYCKKMLDRGRQQDPEMRQTEEASTARSTEQPPMSSLQSLNSFPSSCDLTSGNKHHQNKFDVIRHVEVNKVHEHPDNCPLTLSPPVTLDSEGNEVL
ncbi:uncharacterized protein LOC113144023 isoform X2 [Mastacembelus armatus]|uniref:uncharacterized protein LOC113144023 isoform X2 n=1 Tax=Mastacembelus armatus TaxID=205130 RepID=UPI000E46142C|nr:uncharacterized protein LOC113144023 isoform X2 [Mastacembelus armatus]